ncbi:MAG: hypothetical protein J6N92_01540 [Alloprevotella sp.]|nr:hypothetical protein [Alloprevotella sp.]
MKHRLLTALTAALLALSAWADGTKIGGIYYDLDSNTKTASVTYTGTGKYSSFNPSSTAYTGSITTAGHPYMNKFCIITREVLVRKTQSKRESTTKK